MSAVRTIYINEILELLEKSGTDLVLKTEARKNPESTENDPQWTHYRSYLRISGEIDLSKLCELFIAKVQEIIGRSDDRPVTRLHFNDLTNEGKAIIEAASYSEETLESLTSRYLGSRSVEAIKFARDFLPRVWPHLQPSAREKVRALIQKAFHTDDPVRERGHQFGPLGDTADRAAWDRVKEAWEKQDLMQDAALLARDASHDPVDKGERDDA